MPWAGRCSVYTAGALQLGNWRGELREPGVAELRPPGWSKHCPQGDRAQWLQFQSLADWAPRRIEGQADLFEQLLTRVGLGNEPAKPLGQHSADLVLLGKSAAQHDVNAWVERLQFLEYSVPIHHRQEEIQDDQADLTMDLLEDFQRLETVLGDDHFIPFFRENCGGKLRNFRFVVDDQDQFARSIRIQNGHLRWN